LKTDVGVSGKMHDVTYIDGNPGIYTRESNSSVYLDNFYAGNFYTSVSEIDSIQLVSTNITCNGLDNGNISVLVYGGTSPYTYNWDDGNQMQNRNNLSPGWYKVTVTDDEGQSIIDSDTLELSGVVTDDSIDITVIGGIIEYSYLWSNDSTSQDLTGLDDGTYSVVVTDANDCTIGDSYEVSTLPSPPAEGGGDPPPEPIRKKCHASNGKVKVKNGRIQ
jgi:hypothetical protein